MTEHNETYWIPLHEYGKSVSLAGSTLTLIDVWLRVNYYDTGAAGVHITADCRFQVEETILWQKSMILGFNMAWPKFRQNLRTKTGKRGSREIPRIEVHNSCSNWAESARWRAALAGEEFGGSPREAAARSCSRNLSLNFTAFGKCFTLPVLGCRYTSVQRELGEQFLTKTAYGNSWHKEVTFDPTEYMDSEKKFSFRKGIRSSEKFGSRGESVKRRSLQREAAREISTPASADLYCRTGNWNIRGQMSLRQWEWKRKIFKASKNIYISSCPRQF